MPDKRASGPTITIDTPRAVVTVDGVEHEPAPKVWKLILHLASRPRRIVTHDQLLSAMGSEFSGPAAVPTAVRKARRIVGLRSIRVRTGLGYIWGDVPVEIIKGEADADR